MRTNRSARRAGARFERAVADYLAAALDDEGIDRQVKTGARDSGDIRGVRAGRDGRRVAIECKDCARLDLAGWVAEAEVEASNIGTDLAVVVHKRRGAGDPARQYVTMTLETFAKICAKQ